MQTIGGMMGANIYIYIWPSPPTGEYHPSLPPLGCQQVGLILATLRGNLKDSKVFHFLLSKIRGQSLFYCGIVLRPAFNRYFFPSVIQYRLRRNKAGEVLYNARE